MKEFAVTVKVAVAIDPVPEFDSGMLLGEIDAESPRGLQTKVRSTAPAKPSRLRRVIVDVEDNETAFERLK